jgi:hypothetical protein
MDTSLNRPAVDVGPPRARPGIALVLGLLSLPGSTIAWELPLGGLWIGLPLGVAAIVLGVRARRRGVGVRMATAAIVLAGLAIAQMVVWTAVSVTDAAGKAAPTGTLTFKELDRGASFTHIRNTTKEYPQSNLQGDLIASVSPLVDRSGTRIGKLHLACITTSGARNLLNSEMTCTSIAALRDGTLTVQFVERLDRRTVGAVTGGTGAYANASGTFVSKNTKRGAVITITFGGCHGA